MTPPLDPPGPGVPPGADDDAIPLLTEVVEVPRYSAPDLPARLADVDWATLARQVQDNVMERLMRRSEALLEQSLRGTLDTVIGRATEQLQADLQGAISQLTREVVARAVAEELARVQAEIANGGTGDAAPI
jgi:hypothetical protein